MDDKEVLMRFFEESKLQARQHADQREKVTNNLIILSAGLLAFASQDGIDSRDAFIAVFLIVTGLFGLVISYKHYEQNRRHAGIANAYKKKLVETMKTPDLPAIQEFVEKQHGTEFPRISRWRLNNLWSGIYLLIILAGLILLAVIFLQ